MYKSASGDQGKEGECGGWIYGIKHPKSNNYFSKKYRNTPPIYIAIRLPFVSQYFQCPYSLRKGKYCQYASHLYRNTPPICIAIHLPFVSQYFWENLGGCAHRDAPQLPPVCLPPVLNFPEESNFKSNPLATCTHSSSNQWDFGCMIYPNSQQMFWAFWQNGCDFARPLRFGSRDLVM